MAVTVSKRQIADAKECVEQADKYVKLLNLIIELCDLTRPIARYNKFPDEFQVQHKRSLEVILNDLKIMKAEAQELASNKADRAFALEQTRVKQLELLCK